MKSYLIAAISGMLVATSATAGASDTKGAFFVNAGVGQGQYHVGRTDGGYFKFDDKDTAAALRFGYAWRVANGLEFGTEGGYAGLGKMTADLKYGPVAHAEQNLKGWIAGLNGKYTVADKWYVQARGGWLRWEDKINARMFDPFTNTTSYGSGKSHGDGWYGGIGVGYDFARNFSMGLNYDNYHVKGHAYGGALNIGTYMVSAEFRF